MRHLVIIYTDTTSKEAIADYMERWRQNSRREYRRQQSRRCTFLMQRLMGIALLALTILAVKMLDGDATIALITVPLGLYLVFTGEKVITAVFNRGTKERERGNDTDFGTFRRNRQPTLRTTQYRDTRKGD